MTRSTPYRIRPATLEDRGVLESLIARSARGLTAGAYSPRQIEAAALHGTFGVDSQLIRDGTYFVVELDDRVVGCGGWSWRRTLFGGDAHGDRDAGELDPKQDAARIRAFFVDPDHARKGIGRAILERCEAEARRCGFCRFELSAMLSGVEFYRVHGYECGAAVRYELEPGLSIEFVPMSKVLSPMSKVL